MSPKERKKQERIGCFKTHPSGSSRLQQRACPLHLYVLPLPPLKFSSSFQLKRRNAGLGEGRSGTNAFFILTLSPFFRFAPFLVTHAGLR